MTLIEVRTNSRVINRCDAKCYNAKHPECDCICGGKNHSRGLDTAIANTIEHAKNMVIEYAIKHNLEDFTHTAISSAQQDLFDNKCS